MTPEPEPDRIDLSVLDPQRDGPRWDGAVARVAARGLELRRLRRAVLRRGAIAAAVAAAAGVALWLRAPRPQPAPRGDLLEWAVRDVPPEEVLGHAQ